MRRYGVYRCGFATEQAAYERAFDRSLSALDRVEADIVPAGPRLKFMEDAAK